MANLTYRASATPTVPGSTTVKNTPLTNLEVDANFKALNDDVATKTTPAYADSQSVMMAIALG